jgi:cytoskeletal protein CcmA (bactofilin family)
MRRCSSLWVTGGREGTNCHGELIAEELTIGGHVKGTIHANRVKLNGTAVVEGDIFHRTLAIEKNAWFEGCSQPEDNPPEPRSSIKVESSNPEPRPQGLGRFRRPRGVQSRLY